VTLALDPSGPAGAVAEQHRPRPPVQAAARRSAPLVAYLEASPLAAVFLVFFAAPIVLVVVVSFFDYQTYEILIPDFSLDNYPRGILRIGHLPDLSDHPENSARSCGRSR